MFKRKKNTKIDSIFEEQKLVLFFGEGWEYRVNKTNTEYLFINEKKMLHLELTLSEKKRFSTIEELYESLKVEEEKAILNFIGRNKCIIFQHFIPAEKKVVFNFIYFQQNKVYTFRWINSQEESSQLEKKYLDIISILKSLHIHND